MDIAFVRNFDWLEASLIALFVVFYAGFAFRTWQVARTFSSSTDKLLLKLLLRSIYFALMLIALLGPASGEERTEIQSVSKDIYFLVDLSKSMDARDVGTSRLDKVKFELQQLVNEFSGDRLGLIIFTSEAFLQCPLTYDQGAMLLFSETLNTGLISNSGTDFRPALEMVLKKHAQASNLPPDEETAQIAVMFSDGESFGDDYEDLLDQFVERGIKLFTIGVGTAAGANVPLGSYGFKTDERGKEVVSRLEATALKQMAAATTGRYFEIGQEQNQTSLLIRELQQLKGSIRDTQEIDTAANRYWWLLLLAGACMLIDLVFSVRVIKI